MRSVKKLHLMAYAGISNRFWYSEAREEIRKMAHQQGWDPGRFADVLALTSPRVSVAINRKIAIHYMQHGTPHPRTMSNIRASLRHYEATGEVRGPKVAAFAANLRGNEEPVVLDVWMLKALQLPETTKPRVAERQEATKRVSQVAKWLLWTPAQAQAAIWMAARRITTPLLEPP